MHQRRKETYLNRIHLLRDIFQTANLLLQLFDFVVHLGLVEQDELGIARVKTYPTVIFWFVGLFRCQVCDWRFVGYVHECNRDQDRTHNAAEIDALINWNENLDWNQTDSSTLKNETNGRTTGRMYERRKVCCDCRWGPSYATDGAAELTP